MSRAFVKEGDGALDPLPDLPLSPHPNYITSRGLAALQMRLSELQTTLQSLRARPDRLDKLPEAATERDIRHTEARLRSALVIDPKMQPLTTVAFGLLITVANETGAEIQYEITGEDEADAANNRITAHSPLARALIGAEVGDQVIWHKPSGSQTLDIIAISHP